MKKNLSIILTGIIGISILTGCSSGVNSNNTNALESQITDLQQEIQELKSETETALTEDTDGDDKDVSSSNVQETENEQQTQAKQTDSKETNDSQAGSGNTFTSTFTIDQLSTEVADVTAKAAEVVPTGTASEQREQFLTIKAELESVEANLDLYDDELESAYRQELISWDEYRQEETILESLEDELDNAEDNLEYLFKIDD